VHTQRAIENIGMIALAAASSLGLVHVRAQAPATAVSARAAFEVATIKENTSGRDGGSLGFRPGGTFVASNISAANFVQSAFKTEPPLLSQQIIGLPGWASVVRYDVAAKISTDKPQDAMAAYAHVDEYLRSFLEDRFAFKAHLEKRELPVYALVVGGTGSKLQPSKLDCEKPEDRPKCGMSFAPGRITSPHMAVANLIGNLATASGRPVIDRTNVTGVFDIDLQWNAGPALADSASDAASIFVAVQERLGLKLDPTRASVDVLVVDHIERPTEN
jgi:uncharacterized protein (TIGR03435 family)